MTSAASSIGVLGLGNWGTAIGFHLASKGNDVLGWTIEKEIVSHINTKHTNPLYFSNTKLPENFKATSEISDLFSMPFIVLVTPSSALMDVIPKLKLRDGTILISAVKGMDGSTFLTPLQFAEKYLSGKIDLAVLSGPSFARDIIRGLPSGLVAASKKEETAKQVADLFSNECMKVYVSTDTLGVELGGILKNVIALAAGVCDGINLGDSARAGVITRGLAEMMRLSQAMGANPITLSGLSGLGDLVMTSTCDTSRNRTVGLRLGKGEKLDDIVASIGSVAEGVTTTENVLGLAKKYNIEMPISFNVGKLLKGEITPAEMVKSLILRPVKKEF